MKCPGILSVFFHLGGVSPALFFLFTLPAFSLEQTPLDSFQFKKLIEPAQARLENGQYSDAQLLAREALNEVQRMGEDSLDYQAVIYGILGDCSYEMHRWPEARTSYQQGLQLAKDLLVRSDLLNKLGRFYIELKDYERAGPLLEEALELRRANFGDQHLLVADVINNLGISYLYIGDFIESLDYQHQALRIRQAELPFDDPRLGQSYNNLGRCYQELGDLDKARQAFEEALLRYPETPGLAKERADVLLNLGDISFQSDAVDQAEAQFQQALSIYRKIADVDGQAICLNNLGNVWFLRNRPEQGEKLLRQALQIRQQLYGATHPDVAASWNNIALIKSMTDQPEQAMEALMQCQSALNFHPGAEDMLDRVNDYPLLINTLYNLADLYYTRYLQSDDQTFLLEAIKQLDLNDQVLDYLRIRYEARGSKLNLVAIGHEVYAFAIALLLELQSLTGESRYWHQAFRYSEKSKALLLLDGMYRAKARTFGGVPEHVLAKMDALQNAVADLEKELYLYRQSPPGNPREMDSLEQQLFLQRRDFHLALQEIRTNYPRYYDLRYENPVPSIPRIQQELLDTNQTLIEYFIGVDLIIFVINRDQFDVVLVPLDREFEMNLDTLIPVIRRFPSESTSRLATNLESYASSAFSLYRSLIDPVRVRLNEHLIIVPDDKLAYLPFDALLTQPVDSLFQLRDYPYLVHKYSISYNFSASQLEEMKVNQPGTGPTGYLGFAPEFAGMESLGLSRLLFNGREVEVGKEKFGGRMFVGSQATKNNFIKNQSAYGILHLATHGKVNINEDDFSFLAFSQSAGENQNEYLLYLREIYDLPIQARMVILSACETGTGKLYRGEGIASLARGFSYAGANSLIATRWNINDETTSDLMAYFLENIRLGERKDAALQKAILEYLGKQDHSHAHPFYWSAFMAIGNMDSLHMTKTRWWPATLLALALLALFFYFNRKKNNRDRSNSNPGA